MPGRSTLMTSKRSVSAGRTAVKSRREVPRPCSSRSGSPERVLRDSGAVTRSESSIVLLMRVVSEFWVLKGQCPVLGLADRLWVSVDAAVRTSGAVVEATRAPLASALAAGLPALSRCAIPHEMVTTESVARSRSIIRSSRRVRCPCGDVGVGQELGGGPLVVTFVFVEA